MDKYSGQSHQLNINVQSPYKGSAQITREQFLFHEMRTTAKLMKDGCDENTIIEKIVQDNLFQYPTEKSIRQMTHTCIRRLKAMNDQSLITAIATQPSETAKQICLYAMMMQYRLVWDFMITVIGTKYRTLDMSFGRIDVNTFMMRLQEQDDLVASWSNSTIAKACQILTKILVENDYIDSPKADRLNPVMISPVLENAIKTDGITEALPAFNCLLQEE